MTAGGTAIVPKPEFWLQPTRAEPCASTFQVPLSRWAKPYPPWKLAFAAEVGRTVKLAQLASTREGVAETTKFDPGTPSASMPWRTASATSACAREVVVVVAFLELDVGPLEQARSEAPAKVSRAIRRAPFTSAPCHAVPLPTSLLA